MPLRPESSEFDHDPSLDMFRDAAAQVFDDRVTGFVVFRVQPWWTRIGGLLWWTRWARGVEHVEFIETVWLDAVDAPDPDKVRVDDGAAGPQAEWLDDLRNGSYTFYENSREAEVQDRERTLSVRWLVGDERTKAMREWGFGPA